MKLIVGLGNPGEKYKKTRHNIGFMVLEKIALKKNVSFKTVAKLKVNIAQIENDTTAKLIQPQTYMNDSGRAVEKVKNYFKIDLKDIWVIYDDVDLAPGKIRINFSGRSAGHKGVQSIIDCLGEQFWRIRIGVGKSERISTEKRVLENFSKNETEIITKVVDKAADRVIESLSNNLKEETIIIDE